MDVHLSCKQEAASSRLVPGSTAPGYRVAAMDRSGKHVALEGEGPGSDPGPGSTCGGGVERSVPLGPLVLVGAHEREALVASVRFRQGPRSPGCMGATASSPVRYLGPDRGFNSRMSAGCAAGHHTVRTSYGSVMCAAPRSLSTGMHVPRLASLPCKETAESSILFISTTKNKSVLGDALHSSGSTPGLATTMPVEAGGTATGLITRRE